MKFDNIAASEVNRARMMSQLNKGAWMQRQVEKGGIRSHSELLQVSTYIGAGPRVFSYVQDYVGNTIPAYHET